MSDTQQQQNDAKQQQRPAYRVALGGVQGAVFAKRTAKGGTFYTATVEAFWWSDQEGKWRTSSNFGAGDLGNLSAVSNLLQEWILKKTAVEERSV